MSDAPEVFDIHVCRKARWTIDARGSKEADAIWQAQRMLADDDIDGVRVVRVRTGVASGREREEVVFEEMVLDPGEAPVTVGAIDDVPDCEDLSDLYRVPSQIALNRLFGPYIGKYQLPAIEIMHNHDQLKRILDTETVVYAATAKVGAMQARAAAAEAAARGADEDEIAALPDAMARTQLLNRIVDDVIKRAREAQNLRLPDIDKIGMDGLLAASVKLKGDRTWGAFIARATIARELNNQRGWVAKLKWLMECAHAASAESGYAIIDAVMSDLVAQAGMIREIIGRQPDLVSALTTLLEISIGDPASATLSAAPDGNNLAQDLQTLIATGRFPDTQSLLVQWVARQMKTKRTLTRGGDHRSEREAFDDLVAKVIGGTHVSGGATMAAAVVDRLARIDNRGSTEGLIRALDNLLFYLDDADQRVGLLIDLSNSTMAGEIGREIEERLRAILLAPRAIGDVMLHPKPENETLRMITAIYRRVNDAGIPQPSRQEIRNHIDHLLNDFITGSRIVSRIQNFDRPLHVRALMLLGLCGADMMPDGAARQHLIADVLKFIDREGFEGSMTAEIADPDEQKAVISQYRQARERAGLDAASRIG